MTEVLALLSSTVSLIFHMDEYPTIFFHQSTSLLIR